ncbi:MAG: LLM class flavin-dependent oxidoreductase [Gammaproteobacteria bacterium]|nr:LLM class flavin-dependent oxidoreductase [Gammaproteobacteria bacterium]
MNCVSHIHHGLWRRAESKQTEYTSLHTWVELAKLLEKGCIDALFLADVIGLYDAFQGDADASIREAMQVPVNDPAMLISAMAHATEHLGFAYTSSVLQAHPFTFARQISTLDHLTNGRIAWNVVTSYLPNAGTNLGFGGLPAHDERYARADEYLEVAYKLWEGSWEDDAVVRNDDYYADPTKVHAINHEGPHYQVAGPHLSEPSLQRTPLLFQAGSSERGREFAAKHAECVFMMTSRKSLRSPASVVENIRTRAKRLGRDPHSMRFFQALSPVVGGTEAEAKAKEREYREQLSTDAGLAHLSGSAGVDLSTIDPDRPLEELDSQSVRGFVKGLIESAPKGTRTFRDLVRAQMSGQFLVGTPEQVADTLQDWHAAGVDGFNLVYTVTPGSFEDFVEGVVPVLQKRGCVQREYTPGPLRQKLFGQARLPSSHPGASYRR